MPTIGHDVVQGPRIGFGHVLSAAQARAVQASCSRRLDERNVGKGQQLLAHARGNATFGGGHEVGQHVVIRTQGAGKGCQAACVVGARLLYSPQPAHRHAARRCHRRVGALEMKQMGWVGGGGGMRILGD